MNLWQWELLLIPFFKKNLLEKIFLKYIDDTREVKGH